ncbi:MAG: SDR family oxidoreductase [Candidatus Bathyarchaeia archaeon]|jgi:3-oxoacyl-[acyl-carrier protein] reductase
MGQEFTLRLSGKVAIITGSTGGIGHAAALELAKEGANIVLQYRSKKVEADNLAGRIAALGRRAILAQVDFTNVRTAPNEVEQMVNGTIDQLGRIDALVNLAGYPAKGEWNKRFMDLSPEDFFKPINVDLFGSYLCARAAAPYFLKQKSGVIVNVSSTPALSGHDRGFAFTVAKAGVIGLTKALAFELAPHVRVNTLALGNVETTWVSELSSEELSKQRQDNLIRRFGSPEEIAKSIVFLCSNESSFLNGQTIVLDGGSTLH